jgi:serine/threonine protein kinase
MNAVLDVDLTGARVSHYVIVGAIAAGSMGQVYLGRDEYLQRHVAIKVLRSGRSGARCEQRLLAEARLHSQFSHPSVAAVYDFVEHDGREYLVMEFVPGVTLNETLASGPLPAGEVIRLGVQLARGLAAAHTAGVIHRDLKPQNIRLTPAGHLKIVDFGIAVASPVPGLADSAIETHSSAGHAGTVPYMAPEQLHGSVADERSDIFSAGAVLYEMATGQPAFPQRTLAELVHAVEHQDPPPLAAVNPFVPAGLERIVTRALQKEPARRFPSAGALAAALRSLQAGVRRAWTNQVSADRPEALPWAR